MSFKRTASFDLAQSIWMYYTEGEELNRRSRLTLRYVQ